MVQEEPTKDQTTILILGTVRSEKQDFFSKLNSFSLLMVIDKDGRTILNIPAWPVLVALAAFFVVRAKRSRQHGQQGDGKHGQQGDGKHRPYISV